MFAQTWPYWKGTCVTRRKMPKWEYSTWNPPQVVEWGKSNRFFSFRHANAFSSPNALPTHYLQLWSIPCLFAVRQPSWACAARPPRGWGSWRRREYSTGTWLQGELLKKYPFICQINCVPMQFFFHPTNFFPPKVTAATGSGLAQKWALTQLAGICSPPTPRNLEDATVCSICCSWEKWCKSLGFLFCEKKSD